MYSMIQKLIGKKSILSFNCNSSITNNFTLHWLSYISLFLIPKTVAVATKSPPSRWHNPQL